MANINELKILIGQAVSDVSCGNYATLNLYRNDILKFNRDQISRAVYDECFNRGRLSMQSTVMSALGL